jgi:hypothetical protein
MKFGPNDTYRFLMAVEKIFLLHWVDGVRKDERYSTYTTLLKAIDVATSPEEVIKKANVNLDPISEACRSRNFYNTSYSKYLLLRAEICTGELIDARRFTVRSVEHVLPQNPAPDSQWNRDFTTDDHLEVVHTAGNLVLLSKSKNSTAQNRDFAAKKTTYLTPRVTDFPRSVQVLSEPVWTKDLIQRRTEEFANSVLLDP